MEDETQHKPAAADAESEMMSASGQQTPKLNRETLPPQSPQERPHFFAENFYAGLRATFFVRSDVDETFGTWGQLLLFVLIGVTLQFAADFVRVGSSGEFAPYGLPGALFVLPVAILAACAVAFLARRPQSTLPLMVLFSSISAIFEAGNVVVQWFARSNSGYAMAEPWEYVSHLIAAAWLALACALAAARLFDVPAHKRILAFCAVGICFAGPSALVYRIDSLWVPRFDQSSESELRRRFDQLATEQVFYLQPKLLERELASLKPGIDGRMTLYLVAAAGYSEQDVFKKEVLYVRDLFKRRFGTEGHAIVLVNNPATADSIPIASVTSLRSALARVGATMDRSRDVLFLFLTSHGSKDHKFSLSFGAMQFNDLNPATLRRMLDESGIERRVVVISACYSGGFIDALKDENTLAIASAAHDRKSFGCSNDADFTYFGGAFFDEALGKTDSFIDAFEAAKPAIAARERREGHEPSDPQIFIGARAKTWLDQLAEERNLARLTEAGGAQDAVRVAALSNISQSSQPEPPSSAVQLAAARALVNLTRFEEAALEGVRQCKNAAAVRTAEHVVRENPNYFGGVVPGSKFWPEAVTAYQAYFAESCDYLTLDADIDLFARTYASDLSESEIAEARQFFSSRAGLKFAGATLVAEAAFMKHTNARIAEASAKAEQRLFKSVRQIAAMQQRAQLSEGTSGKP